MSDEVFSRPEKSVSPPHRVLCFEPFRFDGVTSRLYRDGSEIHLVPKAAAVLGTLLQYRGETVSKETFFDTVWEGVHVADESLTQAISTIRHALGDAAQHPEYIETLPGKGYRFIAPIRRVPTRTVTVSGTPSAGDGAGRIPGRSRASRNEAYPPRIRPAFAVDSPPSFLPGPEKKHEAVTALGRWRLALPWVVAAASLAIAVGIWAPGPTARVATRHERVTRFTDPLPTGWALFVGDETHRRWGAVPNTLTLSPDGRHLAYVARQGDGPWRLYLRPLDEDTSAPRMVEGSDDGRSPLFSPDGLWLGFVRDGFLYRAPVAGGAPQRVCEAVDTGATWGPDDTIVYGRGYWSGLGITQPGGSPRVLTSPDFERRENAHLDPVFLPGGGALLYTLWPGDAGGGRDVDALGALTVATGETKSVLERGSGGRYLPPGYLVFVRAGQLQAQAFDPVALEVTGSPVSFYETERGLFSVSASGDLAYITKPRTQAGSEVVWVDETGAITQSVSTQHMASQVRASPDGTRVAAALVQPSGEQDIWIIDAAGRAAPMRVTFDGVAALPSWSPDGKWVAYKSTKNGPWETFRVLADGTGEAELLIAGNSSQWLSWHPYEPRLVFGRDGDIWAFDLEAADGPRPLIQEEGNQYAAQFSPDGAWLAYTSTGEGEAEIFVRAYPELAPKHKLSLGGGMYPRWAPDGSRIYYSNDDRMMTVAIDYGARLVPAAPRRLFALTERFSLPTGGGDYDVAADGQFVMVKATDEPADTEIEIVLNWVEEVKKLIPPGEKQQRHP